MSMRGIASLAVAALVLAACGGASREYVSNGAQNTYFALPNDWQQSDVTEEATLASGRLNVEWHNTFGDPSAESDEFERDTALTGDAYALTYEADVRELVSISSIRALFMPGGVDPVTSEDGAGTAELLAYTPLEMSGGSGTRVVVNIRVSDDPVKWITIDQSVIIDAVTGRSLVMQMQCSSECYEQHQDVANEIATSWEVTAP
jgi:hypothetical protein